MIAITFIGSKTAVRLFSDIFDGIVQRDTHLNCCKLLFTPKTIDVVVDEAGIYVYGYSCNEQRKLMRKGAYKKCSM